MHFTTKCRFITRVSKNLLRFHVLGIYVLICYQDSFAIYII